jgi:dihydroorotate dehydrogenase (NAD+) catalytic subunit
METNAINPLETILCGMKLFNPIILGSGTVGDSTVRLVECLEHNAGAVVNKTLHWQQNFKRIMVRPHYFYGDNYILNCEAGNELPWQAWKDYGINEVKQAGPLFVSLGGMNIEKAVRLAEELAVCQPVMYEINVSCPHSVHKKILRSEYVTQLVEAVKDVSKNIPLIVKLGYSYDLVELAQAAQAAGADAICTTNSIGPGLAIDIHNGRPRLGIEGGSGGVSGPAIKPIALHCVAIVARAVNIPVIGCGGISSAEDVVEMMMAGATAVQIYTAVHLHGPQIFNQIIDGLQRYVYEMKLHSLSEIIGLVHTHLDSTHSTSRFLLARRWKGFRCIETGRPPAERSDDSG